MDVNFALYPCCFLPQYELAVEYSGCANVGAAYQIQMELELRDYVLEVHVIEVVLHWNLSVQHFGARLMTHRFRSMSQSRVLQQWSGILLEYS